MFTISLFILNFFWKSQVWPEWGHLCAWERRRGRQCRPRGRGRTQTAPRWRPATAPSTPSPVKAIANILECVMKAITNITSRQNLSCKLDKNQEYLYQQDHKSIYIIPEKNDLYELYNGVKIKYFPSIKILELRIT